MASEKNTAGAKSSLLTFIPGIAWFFIVMIVICLPGDDVPGDGWISLSDFDKLIHGGMFGGMVFWFCWPFKKTITPANEKLNIFTRILLAVIVWAFATELIQKYFIPGRAYDLLDWLADSTGAAIAYLYCRRYFAK